METRLTMKQLPETERPYEKMERFGPGALSDAELLAVILRTGTRHERVSDVALRTLAYAREHSELPELAALFGMSPEQMQQIPGIGRVKALQLTAVMEIATRIGRAGQGSKMKAEDPSSVAETYMLSMRYLRSEQVRVLYLNHQNRLIFEEVLEQGGISSVSISERQIIKTALSHHASNLILLHNHPGGDPTPSLADLQVTESIRNAAKSLDIHLLDHIIIGDGVYYSMKEQGVPSGSLSEENET